MEQVADLVRAGRVDGGAAYLDVLDLAVFVDDERGTCAVSGFGVIEAVIRGRLAFPIAQQREFDADLFGEGLVGCKAVHADAEDLGVGGFEFGDISLIRLEFLRSAAGKGEHVKRQDDVLFAAKFAEFYLVAVGVGQREIGCRVADLEMRRRRFRRGLRECGGGQQKHCERRKYQMFHRPSKFKNGGPRRPAVVSYSVSRAN